MTDLFLLSEAQMRRIERYFPRSHGIARVNDRRDRERRGVCDQERTSLCSTRRESMGRTRRSTIGSFAGSRLGVFNKIFAALARTGGKPERIMIDATI